MKRNIKSYTSAIESRETAIRLNNITKIYKLYDKKRDRLIEAFSLQKRKYHRKFYALKNVNLEVRRGEIIGILGRNGAGKSTLLEIIAGVLLPTSGRIEVNGSVAELLSLGIGFNPERTAVENIFVHGTLKGLSKTDIKQKLNEILDFAEINEFIDQPVKTYSNGMMARLGFAVAIQMNPRILIIDEVLAVGDELFRRKCYAKLEEIFRNGCTVLLVSHSSSIVNELCTRSIFLDKGEKILEGPAKLVTCYYQKFLFAKDKERIRNEITQLNKEDSKKQAFMTNLVKKQYSVRQRLKYHDQKQSAFFIPNFKPKSLVEYKNYDVDIFDVCIFMPNGRVVNALVMNDEYIYSYKVRFNIEVNKVFFGMKFKTEKGVPVSGATSKLINARELNARRGEEYMVKWCFKCFLTPGIFYANAGVSRSKNGEIEFLNRKIDALVFKVQPLKDRSFTEVKYCDLINLNQSISVKKIYSPF